ncbi:MAG: ribonucleotide reductase N-terminal alpha domain-containing protein, partial [Nitrososphaerota archaeon]
MYQKVPIEKVIKRDGRVVDFDANRISEAIRKAMVSTNQYNPKTHSEVLNYVLKVLSEKFSEGRVPHVEEIQDIVELSLVKFDLYEVAKAYILYRKERERIREEKKKILEKDYVDEVDKAFSLNALRLMASRYLLRDENGKLIEGPKQMFQRVAALVAIPDILYNELVFSKIGGQKVHEKEDFNPLEWVGKLGLEKGEDGYKVVWNEWHLERMKHLYDELNLQGKMKVSWSEFLNLFQNRMFKHNFENYYKIMVSKKFIPNSPTLFNAGTRLGQLSACFVLDIEDDI